MQPRKLQFCIWRDSIKPSLRFSWFCVFFVSKGNPFWLLFYSKRWANRFSMTDSICHSSLPRTVLAKVTLTTIQFRIHPRTKVDPMFQCVYISTSAACSWSMARVAEKTRLNICANNKDANQPARSRRLISAFVVRCSSFFFQRRSVSQT